MPNYLASGSDLTDIADELRAKLNSTSKLEFPDDWKTAIRSLHGEPLKEKQINFIDYDGTLLYSYTAEEWEDVETLPANPSHDGLVAQGWNWTLQDINSQLTAIPNGKIWVGQNYITQSGDTELDVEFSADYLSPYLGIAVNGEVEVDWGDNSAVSTLTGSSLTTRVAIQHVYSSAGKYTISIHVVSGSFSFYGADNYLTLGANESSSWGKNVVYNSTIKAIRLGMYSGIGKYAFYQCRNLSSITIPNTISSLGTYSLSGILLTSIVIPNTCISLASRLFSASDLLQTISLPYELITINEYSFYSCGNVKNITIPIGVTTIEKYAFMSCAILEDLPLPNTITTIGNNAFQTCYILQFSNIPSGLTVIPNYLFSGVYGITNFTIPSGVTSIGNNAFNSCFGLKRLRFEPTSPPTLGNASVFTNLPTNCIISVPTGSLTAYTTATNYPDPNTYTYIQE